MLISTLTRDRLADAEAVAGRCQPECIGNGLSNAEKPIERDWCEQRISGRIADFRDFQYADRGVRRRRADLVVALAGEHIDHIGIVLSLLRRCRDREPRTDRSPENAHALERFPLGRSNAIPAVADEIPTFDRREQAERGGDEREHLIETAGSRGA